MYIAVAFALCRTKAKFRLLLDDAEKAVSGQELKIIRSSYELEATGRIRHSYLLTLSLSRKRPFLIFPTPDSFSNVIISPVYASNRSNI